MPPHCSRAAGGHRRGRHGITHRRRTVDAMPPDRELWAAIVEDTVIPKVVHAMPCLPGHALAFSTMYAAKSILRARRNRYTMAPDAHDDGAAMVRCGQPLDCQMTAERNNAYRGQLSG